MSLAVQQTVEYLLDQVKRATDDCDLVTTENDDLRADNERLQCLLECAATGLALACDGGVTPEQLKSLWIDPHGLRADIADFLGRDPLNPCKTDTDI